MNLKQLWAFMLLLVIFDGLLTRYALANGAIELNPFVDVSNIAFHQAIELLGISFLIFLNALSTTRPNAVVLGVNPLRATTKANKIAVWVLFIVVTWNLFNIVLDGALA